MTSSHPLKLKLENFWNNCLKTLYLSTQGRLKSGILTRYACATKNNALGYEKIIVISFVGMQKL